MSDPEKKIKYQSARDKFLGLSLESARKSFYPQLKNRLNIFKKNERRLQLLIDSMPARISYVDKQKRYVFVNKKYEIDFGLNLDQIAGKYVKTIIGHNNYSKIKHHIRNALCGNNVHFEVNLTGDQGNSQWWDITYIPDAYLKKNVTGFFVLAIDLTEKKRITQEKAKLEATLRQIQKHEAIGRLSGGIAHDLNKLLMGIRDRCSLMSVQLDACHPHMEHLQAIEQYIENAMNLTMQLLGFAKAGKYELKPFYIIKLVSDSAARFARRRKNIKTHYDHKDLSLIVEVDRRQIEQVFLNIFMNAWQAMPSGGDLYLKTKCITLDHNFCERHKIKPGRFVKISVTDTGICMDKATCENVFDPFFTTKEKNHGTRLGLASAYSIVASHGGAISVYSELGQGTTFNIYLPLSDKNVQPQIASKALFIKGTETILLVDDEKMIIQVGQAMLKKMGYQVLTANSGEQAVELILNSANEIDLVILDLVMPGIDGGETFNRIKEIAPDIPVLLSSGYAITGKGQEIMQHGCNGFIQKPFSIEEISQKVREILDEAKNS
ncbi:MAG: response regulator [Desulfobacteraceae bacterium]|nr:response regulator [Desulfobacteraceae bacterium]